ncbi:cytochrome p450 [Hirsutella rhossiliensis]|uniref:Cytochrome p450 domain-containing protein n=1 Tax=Hirsutella rhossiliensis TaxID=111463 RepID=A0A9P8MNM1_9HYPO|nr:cytochrome p450 domain-containing protein [Hirsutella rhossiliensis]KAH0958380.1 cytochrome p450 domain-containing protein [Hirsutella rhossiliensis]
MDALQQTYSVVAERWVSFTTALVFLFMILVVPNALHHARLSAIPLVGGEVGSLEKRRQAYLTSSRALYNQGYRLFKDGLFRITTSRKSPVVVLSSKFLPQLKKLPDSIISVNAAINEMMEGKYTGIDADLPIIPATIKAQLTPALTRLNATISQEVGEALALEMPAAEDWTEVNINRILMRVVAMVSGRVFIGSELCRNEEYLTAAINYTIEVMTAHRAVQGTRPWLRPFLARRLPEVKQVQRRIREADAFLRPVVEQRRMAAEDESYEKPDDMLQWFIDARGKFTRESSQDLAKIQLLLSFAAIHTTTLTATNVFYDIASLPDFASQVCDEIREALASNGGAFTSNALQSMKMLDSALKETLRLHPPGLATASFQRKVLQSFTLSNGQVVPEGVIIEIPTVAINSDTTVFPDADQFDPLRFYKLRKKARDEGSVEAAALNQFVSISPSSLTFGYGRHACPGRFFAANEMKMIVAQALLKYDFRLSEGSCERYPNIEFAGMSLPDASKRLLCRFKDHGRGAEVDSGRIVGASLTL